jgi:hypothetical protein
MTAQCRRKNFEKTGTADSRDAAYPISAAGRGSLRPLGLPRPVFFSYTMVTPGEIERVQVDFEVAVTMTDRSSPRLTSACRKYDGFWKFIQQLGINRHLA